LNRSAQVSLASLALSLASVLLVASCTTGSGESPDAGRISPFVDGSFACLYEEAVACVGNVHFSCEPSGEFLSTVRVDCDDVVVDGRPSICVADVGCAFCRPDEIFCVGNDVVRCNGTGNGYDVQEECDFEAGFVCQQGQCRNLCQVAVEERSYQGCEFYAADLDNASLGAGRDASAQQYSVVVSNPSGQPTEVIVERNVAAQGEEPVIEEVERITLLPGDLEVFDLERREVDGSSSFVPCGASDACQAHEACWCAGDALVEDPPPSGGEHRDCRCRVRAGSNGMNDGTHSALSSQAYRVRSVLPIIAYQFNPLDNVGVFSNDASLLLPTSAINTTYSVLGWPQTIAHSVFPGRACATDADCAGTAGSLCDPSDRLCTVPNEDFDARSNNEDLRAFLTIVGTQGGTRVTVTLGPSVRRVVGIGGYPDGAPGDVWEFDIGPFDVVNLETAGFNADFTGTQIEASRPVSVFSGSEASDAPRFDTLANRQCCADHLEEQLFPNDTLGTRFYIARTPPRSVALNAAFIDPTTDSVGEFNEPEYVRILAVGPASTTITTTLPPPLDVFEILQGEDVILRADQDFEMTASQAVAVLQILASQQATGIPNWYPGGDPATIAVPPVEQYRDEYVFLTPNLYAFDFVTVTAPRTAQVLLDEQPIEDWNCTVAAADGRVRRDGDPPPEWVIYRCQFSFPDVLGPNQPVDDGIQNDGYHTLRANAEIGLVVYGFDAFVSYAYAGGLDLDPIQ
jgi:hypothetical protein